MNTTFAEIAVGQSFNYGGENVIREEFPAHLLHLESMNAEDTNKGFLTYWCSCPDGAHTLVVAMGTLDVTLV